MNNPTGLQWVAGENTPDKVIITRVFNFGTWEEWQAMKHHYSEAQILEVLRTPLRGQWTKRAKRFAEVVFDVRLSDDVLISYNA